MKALNRDLGVTSMAEMLTGAVPGEEVLLCARNGQPVTYVADRYGFRNPDAVHDAPVNLLLLGDSFTEGICLPEGEDIASQIRVKEPAVVNTGSRGAGPLFELAVLRRWGPKLRPAQSVVFFFEGNDWQNLDGELSLGFLTDALDPAKPVGPVESAANSTEAVERVLSGWWSEQRQSLEGYLSRRSWQRNFLALQQSALVMGIHYPKATADKPEYLQILRAAKATVDQWDGALTLVYVPQVDRFVGLLPSATVYDELRNRVRDAAGQAGLDFVDMVPVIAAQSPPRSVYAADGHFNALGARLAADAVLAQMGGEASEPRLRPHELLDRGGGNGASLTGDFFAALKQDQCRNAANAELARDIRVVLGVDFGKTGVWCNRTGGLLKRRGHHPARPAPRCPEIHQ